MDSMRSILGHKRPDKESPSAGIVKHKWSERGGSPVEVEKGRVASIEQWTEGG